MSYSAGDHRTAQRYLFQARDLAQAGGDQAYVARVWQGLSAIAVWSGQPRDAVHLGRAALNAGRGASRPSKIACCHLSVAHAHARLGDERASAAELRAAEAAIARIEHDEEAEPEWSLLNWFGYCFWDLGQPAIAERYATQALLKVYLPVDRPSVTVLVARAQLAQGDVEQACHTGCEALEKMVGLRSGFNLARLQDFCRDLAPYDTAAARTFRERAAALAVVPPGMT
jgi:hypothetical protein